MVNFGTKLFAAGLAILPCTLAHSWIDNISSGHSVGYIRGFMGHMDQFETYKVLDSDKGVALCANNQIDPTNYTDQFPRLQVKAGAKIIANYTENGHVTLDKLPPDNKPHPGNYSWFWTGIPFTGSSTDGSQLLTFDDLDESNRLSGPTNFDDGVCAQSTANTMGRIGPRNCQSHITIPADTKPGIYALYWVWDFTKLRAVDPSYLELYTSCMDVEVVAGGPASPKSPGGASSTSSKKGPVVTTRVTKTRHHTETITASNPPPRVVKTIYTETFVTVTRTIS